MYLKIHESNGQRIVAACDKELIGTVLEEGKYLIDLKKYSSFYKGKLSTQEELNKALNSFTSANLVGKKAVGVALSKKLVSEDRIVIIKNLPFIQLYRV